MGRIKDLYSEILQANEGNMPGHITVGDIIRLKDMEASEWKEYAIQTGEIVFDPEQRQKIKNTQEKFKENEKRK